MAVDNMMKKPMKKGKKSLGIYSFKGEQRSLEKPSDYDQFFNYGKNSDPMTGEEMNKKKRLGRG